MVTPLRKVPITAIAPQPGDHVTVISGGGQTWRHGIVMDDGSVTDGRTRHSWSAFGNSEYMVFVVSYSGDSGARRTTACHRAAWVLNTKKLQKYFCTWFQNDKGFAMWCSTAWASGNTGGTGSTGGDIDALPLPRAEFYEQKAASIRGHGQHA